MKKVISIIALVVALLAMLVGVAVAAPKQKAEKKIATVVSQPIWIATTAHRR